VNDRTFFAPPDIIANKLSKSYLWHLLKCV